MQQPWLEAFALARQFMTTGSKTVKDDREGAAIIIKALVIALVSIARGSGARMTGVIELLLSTDANLQRELDEEAAQSVSNAGSN